MTTMHPYRILALLAAIACVLPITGCRLAGDMRSFPAATPVTPVVIPAAQPTAGAIYAAGPGLNLYSDRRARDVGDLLTITLIESTMATTTASTGISKKSDIDMGTPKVFGAPITLGGRSVLGAKVESERGFTGKGNSAQSNRLQGSVTVTVVQRLPNGNLVVQGQKNLRLNQGDEVVQIQGVVRSADIAPDNTIPSSKVGDARIAYGGRGPVAQSNAMGWLGRFFNSALSLF